MPTFIKGGVWSKRKNIPKILNGELNLDEFVESKIPTPTYKVYTAFISQSGTSAPTAVVNENTIGTMTITRNNTGVYYFVSPEFNSYDDYGKVLCFISNGSADGSTGVLNSVNGQYVPPINGIQVLSKIASTLTPTDNAIQSCSIEIRLYN